MQCGVGCNFCLMYYAVIVEFANVMCYAVIVEFVNVMYFY